MVMVMVTFHPTCMSWGETILLCSKELSFREQLLFLQASILVQALWEFTMSANTQSAFESTLCAKTLFRSVLQAWFCILCCVSEKVIL